MLSYSFYKGFFRQTVNNKLKNLFTLQVKTKARLSGDMQKSAWHGSFFQFRGPQDHLFENTQKLDMV